MSHKTNKEQQMTDSIIYEMKKREQNQQCLEKQERNQYNLTESEMDYLKGMLQATFEINKTGGHRVSAYYMKHVMEDYLGFYISEEMAVDILREFGYTVKYIKRDNRYICNLSFKLYRYASYLEYERKLRDYLHKHYWDNDRSIKMCHFASKYRFIRK